MSLADEVLALQFGTPQLDALREAAKAGDAGALRTYVYWCAWQGIRNDAYIPNPKKAEVFRKLADEDLIEVTLG